MNANARGAAAQQPTSAGRFELWRHQHGSEAKNSLRRLGSQPLATLMTLLVISVSLALPLGLAKLLTDVRRLVNGWDGQAQVSLYLQKDLAANAQNELKAKLDARPDVAKTRLISPAEALAEFKANSGYGEAVDLLGDNPLPPVLVVYPQDASPKAVESLQASLDHLPGVESADMDLAWVQRLANILQIGQRLLLALGIAMGVAALLVVGNTIRLSIESRREEIRVLSLLGATNGFIRRPFLYMGVWSGFFGGVLSLIFVALFLHWLNDPVLELATLYKSPFSLGGLNFGNVIALLAFSALLGWVGAWVAVGRHLRKLEP